MPNIEEGALTATKQWAQGWFASSGEAYLRSLGEHGNWMADTLKGYEYSRDLYKSNAKLKIKDIFDGHTPAEQAMIERVALGTNVIANNPTIQQKGLKLRQLKDNIGNVLDQAGVKNRYASKLNMSPTGPQFLKDSLLTKNSQERTAAIMDIIKNSPGVTPLTIPQAGKILDDMIKLQRGRSAVKQVYDPIIHTDIGRADVADRWAKWGEVSAEKIAQVEHLGHSDMNLAAMVNGISENKGRVSANNVADFLDIYLHQSGFPSTYRKFPPVSKTTAYDVTHEFEQTARKAGGYIFTSRIAIPHLTQVINFPMSNGSVINSVKGIFSTITDLKGAVDWVQKTGALEEQLHREVETSLRGGTPWLEQVLHQPGFHGIRDFQITASAMSGKVSAEEAFENLLKNPKSNKDESILTQLGVDYKAALNRGKLEEEDLRKAAYTAANKAMFFRSTLGSPFRWEQSPMARTAALYRHFAFQEHVLVKKAFKEAYMREGLYGIGKTAAYFATVFPAAGFLVAATENIITGNDPLNTDINITDNKNIDLYINSLAHASAFGITYSFIRAMKKKAVLEYLAGPVPSTISDFMYDLFGMATKGEVKPVAKDVIRRAPIVGPIAAKKIFPTAKKTSQSDSEKEKKQK